MSESHVTIADVAARAGVSPASVSRVLNGKTTVDPEIVELVRKSVRELGYSPSVAAQSLARGRNNTVAMVVPDLANPLFQGILHGASRAASADGYRILVADTAEDVAQEEPTVLDARQRCDGVILCAPRMSASRLRTLTARVDPCVVVNRSPEDARSPVVAVDYAQGIQDLIGHLREIGHTRLLYLSGPPVSASNAERLRGIAASSARWPEIEVDTLTCGSDLDAGFRSAELVVEASARGVTAVLAFNDLVGVGLLQRLGQLDVHVPDDLSVVGFDDIPFARYTSPPLTTMSVPRQELGEQVWRRLIATIRGGTSAHALMFRPTLALRDSVRTVMPSAVPAESPINRSNETLTLINQPMKDRS